MLPVLKFENFRVNLKMTNDEKIEKIQQELKQLSQKQLELSKAHQQQFFLYRWLQGPDPELQSVKEEIARLDKREVEYLKILQVKYISVLY